MTDATPTPDQKAADLISVLKRRAIDNSIEKAVEAGGFALAHPGALRDLQRAANAELNVSPTGDIQRADGRSVDVHAWLMENHQRRNFLFAPGSKPHRSPHEPPPKDGVPVAAGPKVIPRSEEHTSELQSLMRISYAVFCLKK